MLLVKFGVLRNKILVFFLCISLSIAQQTLFCLKWVQLCLYCSKFLQRGLVVWLKLTLFYLCFDVQKKNQIEKFNRKISQIVIIIQEKSQSWLNLAKVVSLPTLSWRTNTSKKFLLFFSNNNPFVHHKTDTSQNGHPLFFSHFLWLSISFVPPWSEHLALFPNCSSVFFFESLYIVLLNRCHLNSHITRNSWSTNSEIKIKLYINTKHKSRPKTNHYYSRSDS